MSLKNENSAINAPAVPTNLKINSDLSAAEAGVSVSAAVHEKLAADKALHEQLRLLERHLDAFLHLQRIKDNYPAHLIENDEDFVETAFRRRMVAEVYTDLERSDCLKKLDQQAPQTEYLIEKLQSEYLMSETNSTLEENSSRDTVSCGNSSPDSPASQSRANLSASNASLLSRVLAQPSHPLLVGEYPCPWKEVVNDGQDLKIHIRNYKDNREKISFRLEGVVDAPLLCILSVLNEVDLFCKWLPYFTTPLKLGLRDVTNKRLGRVDQMVQFHIDFPWPFANRDACFEVFAVDDFERNEQIVVKMITLDNNHKTPRQRVVPPPPAAGVERIIVDGSLVIKPLSAESSLLSLVWHENCRMKVPLKMVDFVAKMFARSCFQAFRRTCVAAMMGELEQRRSANPFLYQFVANRLAEVGLVDSGIHTPAVDSTDNDSKDDSDNFFDAEETASNPP